MIWLYTPAFVPGSLSEVFIPEDQDDRVVDWTVPRTFVKLHDPEYFKESQKPYKTVLKRSMNDTIRTYVIYDPKGTDHYDITLRFDHLTSNRMEALEHFIISTEGQNIGITNPFDGKFCACTIINPEAVITKDHPGRGWDDDGIERVSEWGNVELHLRVIKGRSV